MSIRFAQIEATTRCNFTCGFCVGRKMRQQDISWNVFKEFILDHAYLEYVQIQGEGEPLMHPRFCDMVSLCRGRGIHVSVTTNGSFLNDRMTSFLTSDEGRVDSLHVSIESANAGEFKNIRGGKLERVVRGLGLLLKRRAESCSLFPEVGFTVTVMKRTLGTVEGIIDLYKSLGLDAGIAFQPLQDMPVYTSVYDGDMASEVVSFPDFVEFVVAADGLLQQEGIARAKPLFHSKLFEDFDPSAGACSWLEQGAYLSASGEMLPCCNTKDLSFSLGKYDRQTEVIAVKAQMRTELKNGCTPGACSGCGFADRIVRAVS